MLKCWKILGIRQWAIFGAHVAFVFLCCRCCDVKLAIGMLLDGGRGLEETEGCAERRGLELRQCVGHRSYEI
jgi:hypothetical protein